MEKKQTNLNYLAPECEAFELEHERIMLVDSDEYYYQGAPDD
ncbi:hypothetical protein SAMN06298214_0792 [Bacteroidales bacterium WCE2004]|jgi:hypothetical protein|nr:hypothetical protein SAMN06298214_0792 [Bacteroidales bacterium WCE2004]